MTKLDIINLDEGDKNMKSIGQKVKSVRVRFGFNQQQFADYLGVDQSYISKCENDERQFSLYQLEKITLLCGESIEEFLSETTKEKNVMAFRASNFDSNDLEAICDINRIANNLREINALLKVYIE
jgi:transcriptional regulator with XRE-family HTH domain